VHDANLRGENPDRFGDKLRQRCRQALTVWAGADPRLDLAGRVHDDLHRFPAGRDLHAARGKSRTAIAGAFAETAKSNPKVTAPRAGITLPRAEFCQIDLGGRDLQRLDIAALVEHQSGGRGVGKAANKIAFADLDRIDAEHRRGFVHEPFERKSNGRP
jgi:hypothetical protein